MGQVLRLRETGWAWEGAAAQVDGNGRETYNGVQGGRMRSIGFPELLVILGVAVLLFGGKKIPEVAKGLGEGIRNFKSALKGDEENPKKEKEEEKVEAKK
jgi:sec-independent protein translocase protein TatA